MIFCLVCFRSFFQLVGDLGELQQKDYEDHAVDVLNEPDSNKLTQHKTSNENFNFELKDFEVVATLGVGGFGRVELVKVE